jgi:hypothetical protein
MQGQINVAQVRETFSTLAYVGARFPIERRYGLTLRPSASSASAGRDCEGGGAARRWSGYELAAQYGLKKGYLSRGGGVDYHRAGNEMLRDLQTGKTLFCLEPPPLPSPLMSVLLPTVPLLPVGENKEGSQEEDHERPT